jgi:alpha-galactosidase
VILMTPSPNQTINVCLPGNVLEKHATQVRELARIYHTGLVDSYAVFKEKACKENDLKKYMASLNHPNRAGHEMIASAILPWFLLPKDTTLALTPPMGWNSWNTFQCNINEKLVKETADKMVSSGMRDAGYQYLVLDDCWLSKQRDKDSNLVADPVKFPGGMKALVDYVHSKGLKFGLYNCAGTRTCTDFPGTKGHEYQDALYYSNVGIDYLKYDWCNTIGQNAMLSYTTMANALRSTGKSIVFSICEWGSNEPWKWGPNVGQLWRTTGDITNKFDGPQTAMKLSGNNMMFIVDRQTDLRKYAGPGHWNDPDMLEVGNGMTANQDKAHFSLWAMLAAPLIAGNDLVKMSEITQSILINKDVIAVDQDALGIQGFKAVSRDSIETWYKPLAKGDWAICILNRSNKTQTVDINWEQLGVTDTLSNRTLEFKKSVYGYQDLWSKKRGNSRKPLKLQLTAQGLWMVRLHK